MIAPNDQIADEVAALRHRGIEAVTECFERYRDRLRLFTIHRTDERVLGRVDWEDILQETFIVIQRRYQEFVEQPRTPFYLWMRSQAARVIADLHRKHLGTQKRSVEREVSLHERLPLQSSSEALGDLLQASGISPSTAVIRREQLATLRSTMRQLSQNDREILVLRHLEHMTNGEVACVLGIDKSAATKRYIRALKRMRSSFRKLVS